LAAAAAKLGQRERLGSLGFGPNVGRDAWLLEVALGDETEREAD
jgi:hypothetical protein